MESKPTRLILIGIKTNRHGDKMHYEAYEPMGGRFHLRGCCCHVMGRCSKAPVLLTSPAVCALLSPYFPGWDITRSLCSPRCETSTMITSHRVPPWGLGSQSCPCLRLCPFPCLHPQNPHENLQGEFLFLSLSLSQPLFLFPLLTQSL